MVPWPVALSFPVIRVPAADRPEAAAPARPPIWTEEQILPRGPTKLNVASAKAKLPAQLDEEAAFEATICNIRNAPRRQEEEGVVRGIAIVLAITGALAMSGIAAPALAAPALAQAGRSASTPYGCDPRDGAYPGYTPPSAYAAYWYGYPRDCGGPSITFYFGPAYYGYRYDGPPYFHHGHHGWDRHW